MEQIDLTLLDETKLSVKTVDIAWIELFPNGAKVAMTSGQTILVKDNADDLRRMAQVYKIIFREPPGPEAIAMSAAKHGLTVDASEQGLHARLASVPDSPVRTFFLTTDDLDTQMAFVRSRLDDYIAKFGVKCQKCDPKTPEPEKSFAERVVGLAKAAGAMVTTIVGDVAPPDEIARRKSICEGCTATDSSGAKLYREFNTGWYSCGALRHESPLRDETRDGCGCVLNLKWRGPGNKCPLDKW